MQLRISAGQFKNKRLIVSENTRPVRERIKLSVFSILEDKVMNSNCLDLFAGSGNLGFEALSRGAKACAFVDTDFDSISSLRQNAKNINNQLKDKDGKVKIIKEDATKYVTNSKEYCDIVFIDAPYDLPIKHVFKYIHELLNDNGIIVYFHSKDMLFDLEENSEKLKIVDSRSYGITRVDFIVKT